MNSVPFLDLAATNAALDEEITAAIAQVRTAGSFILGSQGEAFEAEFAEFTGSQHCVGVGNGLDAITLTLRALGVGPGDDVLVPSHTFIATWLGVTGVGARPVAVEPAHGSYLVDAQTVADAWTERTKAVLPVHLYGEPVPLAELQVLCQQRGASLVADAAQAHGARLDGRPIGQGVTSTWSFYPGKNLGALGDGGAVTTDDPDLAATLRLLRNYGSSEKYVHEMAGVNSRLDELQAAVLRAKLPHLTAHNERRREIALQYCEQLSGLPLLLPRVLDSALSSWHLFVVQVADRAGLQQALARRGVSTQIHYPTAVHEQLAFASTEPTARLPRASRYASQVLSLPLGPSMPDTDVARVVTAVREVLEDYDGDPVAWA